MDRVGKDKTFYMHLVKKINLILGVCNSLFLSLRFARTVLFNPRQ